MTDNSTDTLRVLVLHDSITPYRLVFFKEISKISPFPITFMFAEALKKGKEWEIDTTGLNVEILKTREWAVGGKRVHLWADTKRLSSYDVMVLNDHLDIPSLVAMVYSRLKKVPTLLWTANTINALGDLAPWQIRIKRFLSHFYDHFMSPGSEGAKYVSSLGVPSDRIHICNNVVDNTIYAKARSVSAEEKNALKKQLGLTGPVAFYCGQFIARKGLDTLVEAIDLIDPSLEFSLLALGSGPLLGDLQQAFGNSDKRHLSTPGFIQSSEIYKYYAISDVFILPAHIDTWGMVVNEAMGAGVPVIVSTGAGAHADLVVDGKSGRIFEKGDAQGLAQAMSEVLNSSFLREKMVNYADTILEKYTLDVAAKQFLDAVKATRRAG